MTIREPLNSYLTGNVILNDSEGEVTLLNSWKEYDSEGYLKIIGIVENSKEEKLSYVEVKIKFYDEENNIIKTTSENINELDAGERWKFESIYPNFDSSKVKDYEIKVGEVW
jgi:hypothetical protein